MIGCVLSGGGARGAYEAGVISILAPVLEARGERLTLLRSNTSPSIMTVMPLLLCRRL
jgi:hypothetical protein